MDDEARARFAQLEGIEAPEKEKTRILRAPFGWPGSKLRSLDKLLKIIPYDSAYAEPFGGSGALLLARRPSKFEVYNDRYGGITCFYRATQQNSSGLAERLWDTIFSREEWQMCHDGWENETDLVERAAQWFYMTAYSFSQLGRNWGRGLKDNGNPAGKIKNRLVDFSALNRRLKEVVIENLEWRDMFNDYDQEGMIWYIDPPYIQTPLGTYKHNMTLEDHKDLIRIVKGLKGSAYISGYHHELYDSQDWTEVHEWDIRNRMTPMATSSTNNKTFEDFERGLNREVLWVLKK